MSRKYILYNLCMNVYHLYIQCSAGKRLSAAVCLSRRPERALELKFPPHNDEYQRMRACDCCKKGKEKKKSLLAKLDWIGLKYMWMILYIKNKADEEKFIKVSDLFGGCCCCCFFVCFAPVNCRCIVIFGNLCFFFVSLAIDQ